MMTFERFVLIKSINHLVIFDNQNKIYVEFDNWDELDEWENDCRKFPECQDICQKIRTRNYVDILDLLKKEVKE